jgi:hypothetical protein
MVDEKTSNILLHQKTFILKILITFRMEEAKPKYMPLPPNINFTNSQPTSIPNNNIVFMRNKGYQKTLGIVNHIANRMHSNIAFAVNMLMQYASDPSPFH